MAFNESVNAGIPFENKSIVHPDVDITNISNISNINDESQDRILNNDDMLVYDNIINEVSEDMPANKNVIYGTIEQQANKFKILDIESSKLIRNKNKNNPFISYMNINSLRNKIHDLRSLLADLNPEVITISETKIDHTFPAAQFMIDGYINPENFRKYRNEHGGGLITYIKRGIPHKRLRKIEPKNLEVTCIELIFGKRKWGYVTVYRPPNVNITSFFTDLATCLEEITNTYDHIIVTGDININTQNYSSPGYQIYKNFIDVFSLKNLIKYDTCYTKRDDKHTSSSVDVFLKNNANKFFNTHTITTGISDCHTLIGSLLRATYKRSEHYEIEYRNYKKLYQNFDSFKNEIDLIDQNIPINQKCDPNKYYDVFTSTFEAALNRHAPLKKKKIRGNDGGFANKELRKSWYKRSRLRNIYNKNKNEENWNKYKKQRNICTSLKRKAKKQYFIEKTKDQKSFWKIFGPYISNKGHHSQEDYIVSDNGKLVNDKKEVANLFNTYFINIIENSTGKAAQTFKFDDIKPKINQIIEAYQNHPSILLIKEKMSKCQDFEKFQIGECTESEIHEIITKINIKASQGFDKIPPKILKMCAKEIALPLSSIINISTKLETFVDTAKISLCTPLYKNPPDGNRQQIPQYRPINVCTGFSKILERYNLNSMLKHTNKILSKHITAYRKGHSCQNVLLKLTEDWRKHIDDNKIVGGLLMDLSKAFDCLPHELLIAKLEAYGFDKNTLNKLYSYLKNRKQSVKINGILSDFLEFLSGVPQGSILGPILFNIFINDFIFHMEKTTADVFNFADDNTLSACAENISELKHILETAAAEALKWLDANEMIANPDKFHAIILKKPSLKIDDLKINVGNQQITPEKTVKLLGVTIDDKLNFRKHIQNICKAAGAKLNAIKRLGLNLDEKERKLLIEAHVTSNFNYCSTVWHFCGLSEVHKMEKLNERCIRFIYNEYNKQYFAILTEKKLRTLFGKRMQIMCCETYKTINGLNAEYMKDVLEKRTSNYPSRNKNNLNIPKVNQITYGYKSYRVQGPKMWNLLPNKIKDADTYDTFLNGIRALEMPFCSCSNCLMLQIQISGSSSLVDKMLQDIVINDR